MTRPALATAVIGAGPAGLLFSAVARILHARRGGDAGAWPLRLYDKREHYVRTHRLRMAPAPYLAIQKDLADERFDGLVGFLREHDFRPEVNVLEERLLSLAAEVGVHREQLALGAGPGEVGLVELRRRLEAEGALPPGAKLTIVAADSVHSATRELVRGKVAPSRNTHQRVARLRVVGEGLPARLGLVQQVRLSKVLESLVDYRRNANGFAEVDLFLSEREHDALRDLGATPSAPVPISSAQLSALHAPLFRHVVEHLERDLRGRCEVRLHSTFLLEHTVMPRLVFPVPDLSVTVFLVGDAAVSLPFFRGMACLARCVHALAHAHCDLVALETARIATSSNRDAVMETYFLSPDRPVRFGAWLLPGKIVDVRPTVHRGEPGHVVLHRWLGRYGVHVLERVGKHWRVLHRRTLLGRSPAEVDFAARCDPAARYDVEAALVRESELAIVRARGQMIRFVREVLRVSALLPFPVQSWLLRAPDLEPVRDRVTPLLLVSVILGLGAGALAIGGPVLAALGYPAVAWVALPLEVVGGAVYRAAQDLERGPHRWLRTVWAAQIACVFVGSVVVTAAATHTAGRLARPLAPLASLVLAGAFLVGLYLFEAIAERWLARAEL
jgi:hypothetical protein